MPQPNGISTTAYADHLRGCADLAKEIATRMDIREDSARQAMLATLIISADRHNLFLAPTPEHSKAPAEPNGHSITPERVGEIIKAEEADRAAAKKADAQIADVPRSLTPQEAKEVDTGTRRTLFLQTIQSGVDLLNKEGHTPPITPKGLCAYIKKEFPPHTNLGTLDLEELESLTKKLSERLDVLKADKKAKEVKEDLDIPF